MDVDLLHDLMRGLSYSHHRANANTREIIEAFATVKAAVDILIEQKLLDPNELDNRKNKIADKLQEEYFEKGMAVTIQDPVDQSGITCEAEIIDCEKRLHLCKASCCRLSLALSWKEIQQGVVRWDTGIPYVVARNGKGYCVHVNEATLRCNVYECRPETCRLYDCRTDERIWLDFENMVINPSVSEPNWPETSLETEEVR